MMSGSKGHVIHACMNKHDFGTRKNMKKQAAGKAACFFERVIRMYLNLKSGTWTCLLRLSLLWKR